MKSLTVYKASAGSGKTFTLATEYIKLLVENPLNYRSILAVTFTNKATEEMKQRILSQLYGIWQALPDSGNYAAKVEQETGLSTAIVRQRAGEALHLLLHNYNGFRVETIDAFFQSVLRNLARELDLTANLRVGLSGDQVEEMAVDQLVDGLQTNDPMLKWMLGYIMENLSEDKSWSSSDEKKTSFIREIKHFGKTIFRDYYKEHREALNQCLGQRAFIEQYIKQLRQLRDEAKKRMADIGQQYFDTLSSEGFDVTDIKNGARGVSSYFNKLCNGQFDPSVMNATAAKSLDEPEQWYRKTHERAEALHYLADTTLIPLLRNAEAERELQWRRYQSAQLTLAHINHLRLLSSIEQRVNQINDEANLFLLGNTQHLLHSLMRETDTPFVFEKIGAQLQHVMIDEFQDTSTVQWQNFRVLMKECMSHVGSRNLIVGDVKQSVYRWRSGDWRLLNNIEQQFPAEMMTVRPLTTNYRSERNIIDFNNAFFTIAARQEFASLSEKDSTGAQALSEAYADVEQQVPDSRQRQGTVSIKLLTAEDYQERTLQLIGETVRMLLAKGVPQQKIAILVRTNDIIALIANYFAQHMAGEVNIVSDEAFRLDASTSVNLLVQALHLLTHPNDQLTRANLIKTYQREVLNVDKKDGELLLRNVESDQLLPEGYVLHTDELLQLPLYELVERLYQLFELDRLKDQSAYVCAFYDCLSAFTRDNSMGIDAFIESWELELHKKTIQSDEINGIRILTIHKSKGLEYDHVLLPFCDWKLERGETIWCVPTEEPFSQLPIAPIDYSEKKMLGTIYERDYLNEHLQLTVDNLNLLYVAFTRACKNLFVMGRRKSKGCRSALIESVLPELEQSLQGALLAGVDDEQATIEFDYGSLHIPAVEASKKSANVFLQPIKSEEVRIESFKNKTEFRQSNKSRDFIETDDEQEESQSYIKIGSVLHNVFAHIQTTADIQQALQQLEFEGVLYDADVTAEKIAALLQRRLADSRVSDWLSGRWKLFNECTILSTDADGNVRERRPDRVMTDGEKTVVVDFKFGRPHPEYHEQVREYMSLLEAMNMPGVEGYIWYVYSNKIETVA